MTTPQPSASVALLYHRIGRLDHDPFEVAVTPEHFAEHVEVIAALRPLSLSAATGEIESGAVAPGGVVVTFDDGYLDNLTQASVVLARRGVPATVFITTGVTGTRRAFWWEELATLFLGSREIAGPLRLETGGSVLELDLGSPLGALWKAWAWLRRRPAAEIERLLGEIRTWAGAGPLELTDEHRVMTREELATLAAGGLVEIGAHTRTHPMLASRPAAEQNSEITGSRDDLEQWLGRPVSAFAYPFGRPRAEYTRATANLVRDAGFRCACSVSPHPVSNRSRLHEIPRHAPPDVDGDGFESWLLERLRPPRGIRRIASAARERVRRA